MIPRTRVGWRGCGRPLVSIANFTYSSFVKATQIALASCLLASSCLAWAETPRLPPPGKETFQWPGTNTFVATTWTWQDEKAHVWGTTELICRNRCQGPQVGHVTHKVCDLSCDVPCPGEHLLTQMPSRYWFFSGSLANDMQRFGIPDHVGYAQGIVDGVEALATGDLLTNQNFAQTYRSDCFNPDPCSARYKYINGRRWVLTVKTSLYRTTTLPDGRVIRTQGPESSFSVWFDIPLPGFASATYREGSCKCEITLEPVDHGQAILPSGEPEDKPEYAQVERNGSSTALTTGEFRMMEFVVDAPNMNSATLTCTSWPQGITQLTIPAGWGLQCVDGDGQPTMLTTNAVFRFPNTPSFGPFTDGPSVAVRTLCLAIDKPEPRSGLRYRLVPPTDLVTARIARMARSARGGGPADQLRLWIVTDHASLAKVAETIVPSPTLGDYLHEARRAAQKGTLAVQSGTVRKLLPREMLLAPGMGASDVAWLAGQHMLLDGEDTGAWVRAQGTLLKQSFTHRNAPAQIAALAHAFAQGGDRQTALWLLAEGTPADQRKAVAEARDGLLAGLRLALATGTATGFDKWIEAVKPSWGAFVLANRKR